MNSQEVLNLKRWHYVRIHLLRSNRLRHLILDDASYLDIINYHRIKLRTLINQYRTLRIRMLSLTFQIPITFIFEILFCCFCILHLGLLLFCHLGMLLLFDKLVARLRLYFPLAIWPDVFELQNRYFQFGAIGHCLNIFIFCCSFLGLTVLIS